MRNRETQVGFSQRIRLEWFEQTANLVLAGNDKAAIDEALQHLLNDKVSIGGNATRSNREKIITILMKVWLTVPEELDPLRIDGLELLRRLPLSDRMAVHWGMTMAAYPFWYNVAIQVGRLLNLQGSAAAAHVQRRIREHYGERETVSRAARRILTTYRDWDVLSDSDSAGIYVAGTSVTIDDPQLIAWLVEASLHARFDRQAPLKEILGSPGLFPFRIAQISADSLIAASSRLDSLRHGLNQDLVILR